MKIAAITITYNDDYKIEKWYKHYHDYKDDIYLHIIIDNGSKPAYREVVKSTFTNSVIIERTSNGGCTSAYNDGIRYALNDGSVETIMLIANDVKIEKGGCSKLFDFLMREKAYGMVQPVMLRKNSNMVENYGCGITKYLYMALFNEGEHIENLQGDGKEVACVMGGMNLSKREFYEKVGLQDEKLFMYSDEVDMAIGSRGSGYLMAVTKTVKAWHMHVNPDGRSIRIPNAGYLIGRNKVYLGWKHFGCLYAVKIFIYHLYLFVKGLIFAKGNVDELKFQFYFFLGSMNGLFRNMKLNKYVNPDF